MEQLDKALFYNNLLSIYGDLLSSTQKDILVNYYNYDLSLSEIAELKNVTRSAIEDAIKKGQNKLLEFENKLHLLKNKEEILSAISKIKKNIQNNEELKEIDKIERILNYGI